MPNVQTDKKRVFGLQTRVTISSFEVKLNDRIWTPPRLQAI